MAVTRQNLTGRQKETKALMENFSEKNGSCCGKTDSSEIEMGISMEKQTWKSRLRQGSITVEAVYLIPMTVLLTLLLIFFCFCEHARVWYTAAACEAALAGTARTESSQEEQDLESIAETRAMERIQEQPFPLETPRLTVTAEDKKVTVSYASSGESTLTGYFPYKSHAEVQQADPVSAVRTAWLAKQLINGG